ncbi:MAG: hypothetical protein D4S01_10110 [Dehalococcoidia bacterium]|nr:MAG: hypothetical protein D4S01_10110 [Dehalococcoidia bacterium]
MNVEDTIDHLLNLPMHISILLKGNHGIGKSQVVKQVSGLMSKMIGAPCPCIDFRLSQNDVGDLKGMPFHVNGRTTFAPPDFMPLRQDDAEDIKRLLNLAEDVSLGRYGEYGILFLDEINRASREVQQAAFELVLDRRMNLRHIPDGWRVVSAINAEDDIYSVNSMDPAFLSRFFLIDFNPSYQDWLKWAADAGVNAAVVEFIRRFPDKLDPSKEAIATAAAEGVTKIHDRRGWDMFSQTINKFEEDFKAGKRDKSPLDKDSKNLGKLVMTAGGFIGDGKGIEFAKFVETDYNSLDGNIILNKWDGKVEAQLKTVVKKGRHPELAAYNESILGYMEKNITDELSPKQKINLTKYISLVPKELITDFWQKFNEDKKECSEDWYNSDKQVSKLVLGALVNPMAHNKAATPSI